MAISTADENIYVPAVMNLSSETRQGRSGYKEIVVPGYQPRDYSAEKEAQNQLFRGEERRHGIPLTQQEIYVKHRQNMMRLWPRAAEIDSPAPPGHALREFGQSDRDSVENASHDASVPPALALMNGQMMPHILNSWSQAMLSLKQARYLEKKVEAVYLAVLSRKPTADERARWTKAQAGDLTGWKTSSMPC